MRTVYRLSVTEIPEHLLKRSKAAKAKAEGAPAPADDAGSSAPAAAVATPNVPAAPARAAAPAAPPAPVVIPDTPAVAAYKARKKVPVWAMLALAILPVWGLMYARALTPQAKAANDPITVGAATYSASCAGCHGATGDGIAGAGYPFVQKSVTISFPHIEDQLRWVDLATKAYVDAGVKIAGDPNRAGGAHIVGARGVMPAQGATLTPAQLLAAVCYERFALAGNDESGDEWDKWCAPEAPAWVAAEGGTTIADLGSKVSGAMTIGNTPVAGSSK